MCVCVRERGRERTPKIDFPLGMFYGKNVLRSSNDDKTGLDVAFEELSEKYHIFQMV